MPRGLVRYSLQPAVAVSLRFMWRFCTMPVTARPKIGSGASIECPPANGMPAASHTERPPRMTSRATSGASTFTGQPRMAMAINGSPHGVDVADCVGGSNTAEVEGIIDNRHEKIGGGDHAALVIDGVHRRVVA